MDRGNKPYPEFHIPANRNYRGHNYPVFTNNQNKEVPKMEWILNNWTTCLAIFWMAEKVVKITPFPYDDILLDIVWSSIKKALKK